MSADTSTIPPSSTNGETSSHPPPMAEPPKPDPAVAGKVLRDKTKPLKARFRALFILKNLWSQEAVQEIIEAFDDEPSALLKHELGYVLGQMQHPAAVPTLVRLLQDKTMEAVVRHEAGEALGAIRDDRALPAIKAHVNDEVVEVAETCQLALGRMEYFTNIIRPERLSDNPYKTVDPTPPYNVHETNDQAKMRSILLNKSLPLWDRYRAMFSLRNMSSDYSVNALSEALSCDSSALFRHEIAYVLGQMQHELAVDALAERLADKSEHSMVRHECAEALGAIATGACEQILKKYLNDDERIVRESCEVALDVCDYLTDSDMFQYASVE